MSRIATNDMPIFRPMRETDLDAMAAIEDKVYSHGWNMHIFEGCFRSGYTNWVVEIAERVVGYGIMTVAVDEAHILNVAIHADYQGRGLGRKLLRHLKQTAVSHGADTAFLEVRASNASAIYLYESEGFCQVGMRRNYYPAYNGREDAVVMACYLDSASE